MSFEIDRLKYFSTINLFYIKCFMSQYINLIFIFIYLKKDIVNNLLYILKMDLKGYMKMLKHYFQHIFLKLLLLRLEPQAIYNCNMPSLLV